MRDNKKDYLQSVLDSALTLARDVESCLQDLDVNLPQTLADNDFSAPFCAAEDLLNECRELMNVAGTFEAIKIVESNEQS